MAAGIMGAKLVGFAEVRFFSAVYLSFFRGRGRASGETQVSFHSAHSFRKKKGSNGEIGAEMRLFEGVLICYRNAYVGGPVYESWT